MLTQSHMFDQPFELACADESPCFSFASGSRELRATGIFQTISIPAVGGQCAESAIQQAILRGFEQAHAAGQDNPLVVGAIPFALDEPSCLYIPQRSRWRACAAPTDTGEAARPDVLKQTSLPDEVGLKEAVRQAIRMFSHGALSKVVLSVMREWECAGAVNVDAVFRHLCAQNCNDYRFMLRLVDGSTLLGASPELLVRKQGREIVSKPLAGSIRRMECPQADQLNARQLQASAKDLHEHHLVVGDIADKLGRICLRLHAPESPSLSKTAALWHLSTQIEGMLTSAEMNALQIACLLHPTPAICGFPTDQAYQFIRAMEPFRRGFYSGMLGWCDAAGNGEWVITIRCGIIQRQRIRLFAGAGIVDTSSADAEWDEIQTKFGIMRRACGLIA